MVGTGLSGCLVEWFVQHDSTITSRKGKGVCEKERTIRGKKKAPPPTWRVTCHAQRYDPVKTIPSYVDEKCNQGKKKESEFKSLANQLQTSQKWN